MVYEWSLAQYGTFFAEPLYWHTFVRTATMSILATLATLAIAFPAAWYVAKIDKGRAKSLLFVLCLIPFWVSETVRTLGWMILLRESGVVPSLLVDLGVTAVPVELLYHDATILVGLVYTSILFMVVPLINVETLDDSLIEAAYDLGGNGWSILREIVIPHAAPGIAAGAIVVFIICTYTCPTCYCFDIQDEPLAKKRGRRVRLWDSCMYKEYTLHASGHNPRPTRVERLKNRMYHKFKFNVDSYGTFGCVGCGRCITLWPVNDDLIENLLAVKGAA